VVLTLRALGVRDVVGFDWLTPPPVAAVTIADELLRRLGATDAAGALSDRGRRMLRFPVHPRLARVLVEAEDRGVADEGAILAALIGERDVRERGRGHGLGGRGQAGGRPGAVDGGADVIALLEVFEGARAARFSREAVRSAGLDPRATESAERARKQLAGLVRDRAHRSPAPASSRQPTTVAPSAPGALSRAALDRELARAALAGFPDRVGRRREAGSRTLVLAAGGTAELGYEPDGDFLIALDAEERAAGGRGPTTTVRLGCSIDPDWLADVEGGDLRASDVLELDAATERVVRRSRLAFGALTLDETVRPAEPSPEVSRLLVEAALARGLDAFDEPGALASLRARLQVVARAYPELAVPALGDDTIRATLTAACEGLRSFSDLRAVGLSRRVADALPPAVRARLATDAPGTVTLPGGRPVPVHYETDQPPWIESRLQDFFGLVRGPSVAGGRTPLTLHLLAPNGRAVQVTNDLDSFWRNHYPTLRRELGRRYPRHAWPEDGRTATPPPPRPPRAAPSGRR
jgi:ATP-dependent helicase HrpB